MVTLDKKFKEAVERKDTILVRVMLKNSLLLSSSEEDFDDMLNYAKEKLPDLMDAHDGERLKAEEEEWTRDYLDQQLVRLVSNFSQERIGLLQKMVRKLYPREGEKLNTRAAEVAKIPSRLQYTGQRNRKLIGGCIIAVLAIAAGAYLLSRH